MLYRLVVVAAMSRAVGQLFVSSSQAKRGLLDVLGSSLLLQLCAITPPFLTDERAQIEESPEDRTEDLCLENIEWEIVWGKQGRAGPERNPQGQMMQTNPSFTAIFARHADKGNEAGISTQNVMSLVFHSCLPWSWTSMDKGTSSHTVPCGVDFPNHLRTRLKGSWGKKIRQVPSQEYIKELSKVGCQQQGDWQLNIIKTWWGRRDVLLAKGLL
eukprot:Gb_21009 [translate_table: standard]